MDTLKMVFLFLFLSACALPNMVRPGVSQQAQKQDHYQCFRDAQWTNTGLVGGVGGSHRATDKRIYQLCMEARGYARQD